jgi:hypothetical protein
MSILGERSGRRSMIERSDIVEQLLGKGKVSRNETEGGDERLNRLNLFGGNIPLLVVVIIFVDVVVVNIVRGGVHQVVMMLFKLRHALFFSFSFTAGSYHYH